MKLKSIFPKISFTAMNTLTPSYGFAGVPSIDATSLPLLKGFNIGFWFGAKVYGMGVKWEWTF